MFQQHKLDRAVMPQVLSQAGQWRDMPELERNTDAALLTLRQLRQRIAAGGGRWQRWRETLNRKLWTQESEYLDDHDLPDAQRVALIEGLHRFNHAVRGYQVFLSVLRPWIQAIHAQTRRPVQILELASGAGELALTLSRLARDENLPVTITGSDYSATYVAAANAKAAARHEPVTFIELNAFDMSTIAPESVDIVLITQSIHHFTAGQVAMMIAQAMRSSRFAFIGIDGRRSPEVLALAPLLGGLVVRRRDFVHDTFISVRKFYSETELETIARLAAPEALISAGFLPPGYSLLTASKVLSPASG